MKSASLKVVTLSIIAMVFSSCGSLGLSPSVKISSGKPIVARDLTPYEDKRAVILAIKEPVQEKGLGNYFAAILHTEFLKAAPFEQTGYRPEETWFGLNSSSDEEFSTAAAAGAQLGYDMAVIGQIERFVYSRNSNSTLVVYLWFIDTSSGELMHAQRLVAEGRTGYVPPLWDPSLNKPVNRDDIFVATANTVVRRLWVKWHLGETDAPVDEEDEETEETDY